MTLRRIASLILLLAIAAACTSRDGGSPDAGSLGSTASPPASSPATSAAAPEATGTPAAFPATITDDAGREVTIEREPRRIVSLAPSNTEIVCALGACDLIVGVPDFRDGYPAEVASAIAEVPDVVIFAEVDVELVVAAEPDLVLAAGNEFTPTAVIEQLLALDLPVLTLYPEKLDEVYADIELVGAALGRGGEALTLVGEMSDQADVIAEAVSELPAPRTFYEVSVFEGVIFTAGEGSFIASLVEHAGGDPITGDALSTSITLEELVAADPELILLGDAAYDPTITAEAVAARSGWREMTAVRDGRVLPVVDDIIITRPGPRIVDGLAALAALIHPDAVIGPSE